MRKYPVRRGFSPRPLARGGSSRATSRPPGPDTHAAFAGFSPHARVDRVSGERPQPQPQVTVIADPTQVTLVAQAGFSRAIRAQRIGVGDHLATRSTGPHLLLLPDQ